jgi:rifampicin phosphotransferase
MAAAMSRSGENLRSRFVNQIAIRQSAEKKLDEYLTTSLWRRLIGRILRKEISYLQYFSPIREETQSVVYYYIDLLRKILLDIGALTGLGEYIFYLKEEELKIICEDELHTNASQLIKQARERKYVQELSRRIYLPHIFEQKDLNLNLFCEDISVSESSCINGTTASSGKVHGRAVVMDDLDEAFDINPDDVIIAKFADPSFTPILLKAAGLVLEQGSIYSHCAIVAREFGLPVVVNAQGATSRIKSGQLITLDADRGKIWWGAS